MRAPSRCRIPSGKTLHGDRAAAAAYARDAGISSASRKATSAIRSPVSRRRRAMKRFYREAAVGRRATAASPSSSTASRCARRPRRALIVPSRALAEAIAAEWQGQGDDCRARCDAADAARQHRDRSVAPRRDDVIAEIAKYAGTDLLCYRADAAARSWSSGSRRSGSRCSIGPSERFGAPLVVTHGRHAAWRSRRRALAALERAVAAHDAMRLVALHLATAACGSVVLGAGAACGAASTPTRPSPRRSSTRPSRSSAGARMPSRPSAAPPCATISRSPRALPLCCAAD